MKIAVIGLWHLGCVTAACLANAGHDVIAYDPNEDTIQSLKSGKAPLFEPGLDALLTQNVSSNKLHYSSSLSDLNQAEIAWITYDTPVDDNDIADVSSVMMQIKNIFPHLKNNALVLISSQLPVGSTRKLLQQCNQLFPDKKITFACSPENLRLGKAIDVFTHPDRVIVGLQTENSDNLKQNTSLSQENIAKENYSLEKPEDKTRITELFKPFTDNIVWMSIESAEMTKHALNAFLATSVVFINELSTLCEKVGANAADVEKGLKTEERIGKKAYLRPGNAIAGGTLARDVNYLIGMGHETSLATPLFSALLQSNDTHKQWSCRRIIDTFKDLKNKTITTLGLTYKTGTDTLRRSTAVETCRWLAQQGAKIIAYDPGIQQLPDDLTSFIQLKTTLHDALEKTDAVIIATEHPEFTTLDVEQLLEKTPGPCIFDASGFLAKNLGQDKRIRYFSVGRQA